VLTVRSGQEGTVVRMTVPVKAVPSGTGGRR